ncbi:MAG: hypothetical protein EPN91_02335 [Salinibacterium sp.]|nr:MAG: hypothetical protein EPN91_02335 [Salinibacterium sp.]
MGTQKELVGIVLNDMTMARFGTPEGASPLPAWAQRAAEMSVQDILDAINADPQPAKPPATPTFSSVPPTAEEFKQVFGAEHDPTNQQLVLPLLAPPFDRSEALKRARFGFSPFGYRGVSWTKLPSVYKWLHDVEEGREIIPAKWDHDCCIFLMLNRIIVPDDEGNVGLFQRPCPSNDLGYALTGPGGSQNTIDTYLASLVPNEAGRG